MQCVKGDMVIQEGAGGPVHTQSCQLVQGGLGKIGVHLYAQEMEYWVAASVSVSPGLSQHPLIPTG